MRAAVNSPLRTLALSAGVVALTSAAVVAGAAPDVSGWKTYRNRQIGLEFRYPVDYRLKQQSWPDGRPIAIGLRATDWSLDIRVATIGDGMAGRPGDTAAVFRLAVDVAKGQCAADGPDSSVSCPDVLKNQRFTTASGRAGLELYLAKVTELYGDEGEPDRTERQTKGPIYAVDISTNTAARVLLFTVAERAESHEHGDILRAIIDSVRVVRPVSVPPGPD